MRPDFAERQRLSLQSVVPNAHVRKRPQQPVLLDRRAREQRLRGKLVVQRRVRGTKRRQIGNVKRVRDVSVVLGLKGGIPRVRMVPVLRGQDVLDGCVLLCDEELRSTLSE